MTGKPRGEQWLRLLFPSLVLRDMETQAEELYFDRVMTFGTHRGQLLSQVPDHYLSWMTNPNFSMINWKEYARKELERRERGLPIFRPTGLDFTDVDFEKKQESQFEIGMSVGVMDLMASHHLKGFLMRINKAESFSQWSLGLLREVVKFGVAAADQETSNPGLRIRLYGGKTYTFERTGSDLILIRIDEQA